MKLKIISKGDFTTYKVVDNGGFIFEKKVDRYSEFKKKYWVNKIKTEYPIKSIQLDSEDFTTEEIRAKR